MHLREARDLDRYLTGSSDDEAVVRGRPGARPLPPVQGPIAPPAMRGRQRLARTVKHLLLGNGTPPPEVRKTRTRAH